MHRLGEVRVLLLQLHKPGILTLGPGLRISEARREWEGERAFICCWPLLELPDLPDKLGLGPKQVTDGGLELVPLPLQLGLHFLVLLWLLEVQPRAERGGRGLSGSVVILSASASSWLAALAPRPLAYCALVNIFRTTR